MDSYFYEDDTEFCESLTEALCDGIDKIYKGKELGTRKVKPRAEVDPYLHGFWGYELHTMSS